MSDARPGMASPDAGFGGNSPRPPVLSPDATWLPPTYVLNVTKRRS